MPSRSEIHYFGAGPAAVPTSVLERASASLLNHASTGLGLAEHSHRSSLSSGIISSAQSSLRALLNVPEDYSILFMQGGGTTQFSATCYNLTGYWVQKQLSSGSSVADVKAKLQTVKADYLITGGWSQKASKEAERLLGKEKVHIATDSKAITGKYGVLADEKQWKLSPVEDQLYTYYCDNETVDGVEFPALPSALQGRLVCADISSNILSRRVPVSEYGLLYAGAQKNVGITGITIVIIRSEILNNQPSEAVLRELNLPIPPVMMHYPTLAAAKSLYNTLPIFDVYIAGEVMKDLLERGGLETQEEVAGKKAEMLYAALDCTPAVYKLVASKTCRSRMNICFTIQTGAESEAEFLRGAEERGMIGLKGHRSVGGIRISNYNSISIEAAEKLTAWINEFAAKQHTQSGTG